MISNSRFSKYQSKILFWNKITFSVRIFIRKSSWSFYLYQKTISKNNIFWKAYGFAFRNFRFFKFEILCKCKILQMLLHARDMIIFILNFRFLKNFEKWTRQTLSTLPHQLQSKCNCPGIAFREHCRIAILRSTSHVQILSKIALEHAQVTTTFFRQVRVKPSFRGIAPSTYE